MFTPLTRSLDKEICETMCIASKLCCYSPSSSSEQISQTTDVCSLFLFVLSSSSWLAQAGHECQNHGWSSAGHCPQSARCLVLSFNTGLRFSWRTWWGGDFHATLFLLFACLSSGLGEHLYRASVPSFKFWSKATALQGRAAGRLA